jgi:hypothetical protein
MRRHTAQAQSHAQAHSTGTESCAGTQRRHRVMRRHTESCAVMRRHRVMRRHTESCAVMRRHRADSAHGEGVGRAYLGLNLREEGLQHVVNRDVLCLVCNLCLLGGHLSDQLSVLCQQGCDVCRLLFILHLEAEALVF